MKKIHTMMTKAASFAHLLGLPQKAARAEDDDDDKKQRPDESDEDYAKRMEEEEKDEKSSKAEDDSDAKAEDDEAEEDEDGDEKKAKGAEDGEDDESMRAGRMAERKRCKAIFASEAAGARPDLAAHLAFETSMSSKEAVALLTAAAAGGIRGRSLADRMSGVTVAKVGTESGDKPNPSDPKAVASRIIAAAKKARGEA